MNKFKYIAKSPDGKNNLAVSADYIARVLSGRNIKTVGYGIDSTFFQFTLSDGGFVRIKISPDAPEIHYYSPSR